MTKADLEARIDMFVSHGDTNADAALDATEIETLATMMQNAGGHGGGR